MSDEHLSHYDLDALRVGAVPREREPIVAAHLASCPRCARAHAALAKDADEFFRTHEAAALANETLAAVEPTARRHGRGRGRALLADRGSGLGRALRIGAVPLAALVLAGLIWVRPGGRNNGARGKGSRPALEVFAVEDTGLRSIGASPPSASTEPVAPGGHLRLRYDAGQKRFVRFLWEGAPGTIEPLYPWAGRPPIEVEGVGPRWLEREVELDRADHGERLHAVFCDHTFGHDEAVGVIRGRGGDRAECTSVDVAIAKRAAP